MKIQPKVFLLYDSLISIQKRRANVIKVLNDYLHYLGSVGEVIDYSIITDEKNTYIRLEVTVKRGEAEYFKNETKYNWNLEYIQKYLDKRHEKTNTNIIDTINI